MERASTGFESGCAGGVKIRFSSAPPIPVDSADIDQVAMVLDEVTVAAHDQQSNGAIRYIWILILIRYSHVTDIDGDGTMQDEAVCPQQVDNSCPWSAPRVQRPS